MRKGKGKKKNMAGIATSPCSSGVLFRAKEGGGNGAFLAHYNGLRPVESMQVMSAGTNSRGFISAPGSFWILVFSFLKENCVCYLEKTNSSSTEPI